jgi:hypothetical protein
MGGGEKGLEPGVGFPPEERSGEKDFGPFVRVPGRLSADLELTLGQEIHKLEAVSFERFRVGNLGLFGRLNLGG